LKASPGIVWTFPFGEASTIGLGSYLGDYILMHEGMIKAVNKIDGSISWHQRISDKTRNALVVVQTNQQNDTESDSGDHAQPGRFYLFELGGKLSACSLDVPEEILWDVNLNAYSNAELIPIPHGGVLTVDRSRIIALDPEGRIQWNQAVGSFPMSWVRYQDQIVFSTDDGLLITDQHGFDVWDWKTTGLVTTLGENLFLYAEDGFYRVDLFSQTGVLLKGFDGTILDQCAITPAEDHGLVLIHTNGHDRRLLLINPTGKVVWERSINNLSRGQWQLFSDRDAVYLKHTHSSYSISTVDIYTIDLETGGLTHIIRTSSRRAFSRDTWIHPMGDGIWLLNTDGGPLGAFDLYAAYQRITQH
jgi:outer membrane protein assembly factor BamB